MICTHRCDVDLHRASLMTRDFFCAAAVTNPVNREHFLSGRLVGKILRRRCAPLGPLSKFIRIDLGSSRSWVPFWVPFYKGAVLYSEPKKGP